MSPALDIKSISLWSTLQFRYDLLLQSLEPHFVYGPFGSVLHSRWSTLWPTLAPYSLNIETKNKCNCPALVQMNFTPYHHYDSDGNNSLFSCPFPTPLLSIISQATKIECFCLLLRGHTLFHSLDVYIRNACNMNVSMRMQIPQMNYLQASVPLHP